MLVAFIKAGAVLGIVQGFLEATSPYVCSNSLSVHVSYSTYSLNLRRVLLVVCLHAQHNRAHKELLAFQERSLPNKIKRKN